MKIFKELSSDSIPSFRNKSTILCLAFVSISGWFIRRLLSTNVSSDFPFFTSLKYPESSFKRVLYSLSTLSMAFLSNTVFPSTYTINPFDTKFLDHFLGRDLDVSCRLLSRKTQRLSVRGVSSTIDDVLSILSSKSIEI